MAGGGGSQSQARMAARSRLWPRLRRNSAVCRQIWMARTLAQAIAQATIGPKWNTTASARRSNGSGTRGQARPRHGGGPRCRWRLRLRSPTGPPRISRMPAIDDHEAGGEHVARPAGRTSSRQFRFRLMNSTNIDDSPSRASPKIRRVTASHNGATRAALGFAERQATAARNSCSAKRSATTGCADRLPAVPWRTLAAARSA